MARTRPTPPPTNHRERKHALVVEPPQPYLYYDFAERVLNGDKAPNSQYSARRHRDLSRQSMSKVWRAAREYYLKKQRASQLGKKLGPGPRAAHDPAQVFYILLSRLARKVFYTCHDFSLANGNDIAGCLGRIRRRLLVPTKIGDGELTALVRHLSTREFSRQNAGTKGALLLRYRRKFPKFLKEFSTLS